MVTLEWETINNPNTSTVYGRAKVPGGWLIEATTDVIHLGEYNDIHGGYDRRISTLFIPDPEHQWGKEV